MLLDVRAEGGQLHQRLNGELLLGATAPVDRLPDVGLFAGGSARRADKLLLLRNDLTVEYHAEGLVHNVRVGRDHAGDDGFAEAVYGFDHDVGAIVRDRVKREHDAR